MRSDFATNPEKLPHMMNQLTKKLEGKQFLLVYVWSPYVSVSM